MAIASRVISIVGLLVFGGLLLFATLATTQFEQAAKSFVAAEVRAQLEPVLDSKSGQELKTAYEAWKARGKSEPAESEADPVPQVAEQLAAIIGQLCHFSCAENQALESNIEKGLRGTLSRLAEERGKIAVLAQDKYKEIITKLRRDVITFAAANVSIFAVLLAVTFIGSRAYRALMLPASVLAISTLISAGVYIFGQNWFFTILFNDYMGAGYLLYVALIFAFFLCVIYVRTGDAKPNPVDTSVQVAGAFASTPLTLAAEAVVCSAEGAVSVFAGLLAVLVPV